MLIEINNLDGVKGFFNPEEVLAIMRNTRPAERFAGTNWPEIDITVVHFKGGMTICTDEYPESIMEKIRAQEQQP